MKPRSVGHDGPAADACETSAALQCSGKSWNRAHAFLPPSEDLDLPQERPPPTPDRPESDPRLPPALVILPESPYLTCDWQPFDVKPLD